jgi:hypothetical protein
VRRVFRIGRTSGAVLFVFATWGASVRAQAPGDSPRPNFLYFRYASRTALALYAGYGAGNAYLVFGMIENPRSDYREIIGGLGLNVRLAKTASVFVATAAASATDSWYAQFYLLPNWTLGRLAVGGTVELYQPLQARGAQQLDVSPCTVLVRSVGRVEVGAAYLLFSQVGGAPLEEAGPAARIAVPAGTVTLELLRRLGASSGDVRVTFQASL